MELVQRFNACVVARAAIGLDATDQVCLEREIELLKGIALNMISRWVVLPCVFAGLSLAGSSVISFSFDRRHWQVPEGADNDQSLLSCSSCCHVR